MKTISVLLAKAAWLLDINDLNPRGKDILTAFPLWMQSKYSFEKSPTSMTDIDKNSKSIKFERGRFQVNGEYKNVGLEIFNDGFIASTWSSTRDSEAFLEELTTSAIKEFSLGSNPDMIRDKIYTSELIVRLDNPFFNLNPKLKEFSDKISQACGYKDIPNFQPTRISFGIDKFMSYLKLVDFMIEPRDGFAFADKRFFSRAPLHTDLHEELLSEFDGLLAGN